MVPAAIIGEIRPQRSVLLNLWQGFLQLWYARPLAWEMGAKGHRRTHLVLELSRVQGRNIEGLALEELLRDHDLVRVI